MSSLVIDYEEIRLGKINCKYCEKEASRFVLYRGFFSTIMSSVCEECYKKGFLDTGKIK